MHVKHRPTRAASRVPMSPGLRSRTRRGARRASVHPGRSAFDHGAESSPSRARCARHALDWSVHAHSIRFRRRRMTARPARRRAAATSRRASFSFNATPEVSPGEAVWLTRIAWGIVGALVIALLVMVIGPHRIGDYMTETDFYGAYAEGAKMIQHGRL